MPQPAPEVLSYDDLREIVETFRQRYWPSGDIPVDVEFIVDVELGLDIVAVPHLYRAYGIDGFLAADS